MAGQGWAVLCCARMSSCQSVELQTASLAGAHNDVYPEAKVQCVPVCIHAG